MNFFLVLTNYIALLQMGSRGGGGGRGTEGSARGRGTDEPPRAPKGFRQENLPTDTFTPRTYQVSQHILQLSNHI